MNEHKENEGNVKSDINSGNNSCCPNLHIKKLNECQFDESSCMLTTTHGREDFYLRGDNNNRSSSSARVEFRCNRCVVLIQLNGPRHRFLN